MNRIVFLLAFVLAFAQGYSQIKIKDAKALPLNAELIADFADWTPDSMEIKGSTQGLAMYRNFAVVVHDKGMCCIYDMKKKALVAAFMMEGNTSHCNNAFFGKEKFSRKSKFPLLYVSECRGKHACLVTDITLEGSRIVQKIYYEGTDQGQSTGARMSRMASSTPLAEGTGISNCSRSSVCRNYQILMKMVKFI